MKEEGHVPSPPELCFSRGLHLGETLLEVGFHKGRPEGAILMWPFWCKVNQYEAGRTGAKDKPPLPWCIFNSDSPGTHCLRTHVSFCPMGMARVWVPTRPGGAGQD
jgi:hypothetical protein